MTPQQLLQTVSSGQFQPVYYFFGSEDYRMKEAERYVAQRFLPNRQIEVNFARIDGRKTKCNDLIAELSVYPMLGEHQVIAVSDFQSYKPKEVEQVFRLLDPPDPNRVVILSTPSARTPKKTSAFFKKIDGLTAAVEFGKLTRSEAVRTINGKLAKVGLQAEPAALNLLVELTAGNRGGLEVEIGKLVNYKESGETITVGDVESIAAGFQVYSVFQLAEDVVSGDRVKVLAVIRRLLAEGNNATGLLFFLGQHFISLYLVKGGKPLEPYRRWLAGRFREQAGKYQIEQLELIITEIAATDSALRREKVKPQILLEQLVLRVMDAQS